MTKRKRNDCVFFCTSCTAAVYIPNYTLHAEKRFMLNSALHDHRVPGGGASITGEDVERFFKLMKGAK